jgi:hypothetical protein
MVGCDPGTPCRSRSLMLGRSLSPPSRPLRLANQSGRAPGRRRSGPSLERSRTGSISRRPLGRHSQQTESRLLSNHRVTAATRISASGTARQRRQARSHWAEGRRARLLPLSRRLSSHAELPGWSFEVLARAQPESGHERPVRRLCGGRSVPLGDEREDGNRLRDSFSCCTECTELYRRNENGGWSSRRSKCKELNLLATGEIGCGGQI